MHGEGLVVGGGAEHLRHKQQQHWDILGRGGGGGVERKRLIHILLQQHLSAPKSSNIFQANAERERE